MLDKVVKRDGRVLPFDSNKIFIAITKASNAVGGSDDVVTADNVDYVLKLLSDRYENSEDIPTVEDIQNTIEWALIKRGHAKTAKEFIIYRHNRTMSRDMNAKLMETIKDLTFKDSKDNDLKRENGNIDGNTSMGLMLKFGSETSKTFSMSYIMHPRFSKAHKEGYIHVHDLDFYPQGTLTCLQIPVGTLLSKGFSTGHGYLRSPTTIQTAAALTAIIIQANQNEQHGGQSVPMFDYYLAPYVAKSFAKNLITCLSIKFDNLTGLDRIKDEIQKYYDHGRTAMSHGVLFNLVPWLRDSYHIYGDEVDKCVEKAYKMTDRDTYQAMEAFVHNMNTMHSRAGAQIPFSSINFGTDTSVEGRMVIENYLKALDAGLGHGETAIFPVSIFKCKKGINFNPEDKNYDLFELACKVTSKRLFPNFSFIDAPFNYKLYKGTPETEVGYMGCADGREVLTVMSPDGFVRVTPFKDLWNLMSKWGYVQQGMSQYVETPGWFVFDSKSNGFVPMNLILRNPDKGDWYRIKTQFGRTLLLTGDHPLVTQRGRVRVSELTVEDRIMLTDKQPAGSEKNDVDLAWLHACVMCDSCYDNQISLTVSMDESDIAERFQRLMEVYYNKSLEIKEWHRGLKGDYLEVCLYGSENVSTVNEEFVELFEGVQKINRRIPSYVFNSDESVRMSFLAGIIDCDGHVNNSSKGVRVQTGFVNKELSLQTAQLARSLGYKVSVYVNHYNSEYPDKERYSVEWLADERLYSYMVCSKKKKPLDNQITNKNRTWGRIISIEFLGYRSCFSYDINTDSDMFDLSGVVSHNCRTRVFGNVNDPSREIVPRRGNCSFTSINLPRLAIESHQNLDIFMSKLDEYLDLVYCQLLERFRYQGRKMVKNFPFLMGQGLWLDSEKLKPEDTLQDVIRHGTLSIGFIGLAEALKSLTGRHHGESDYSQELGLKIISHMRKFCDDRSKEKGLNITLLATPAEGLSGRFVRMDKEKYGIIEGVTDRDYYTNSFHVPVYYECTPFFKLKREAPYHELTNAGHISYVEIDGDPLQNLEAVKEIIRYMAEVGIGYGSINHPVDYCSVCGYTGIINDTCPRCGRKEFEGVDTRILETLGICCN